MTVVFHIRLSIPSVLATNRSLKLDAKWLFDWERLKLRHSVLPVKLSTLLLPFGISLDFLLLFVCIPEITDLLKNVLSFSFRILCDLDQLFNFCTNVLVLIFDDLFQFIHLSLHRALYRIHLLFMWSFYNELARLRRWLSLSWRLKFHKLLAVSLHDVQRWQLTFLLVNSRHELRLTFFLQVRHYPTVVFVFIIRLNHEIFIISYYVAVSGKNIITYLILDQLSLPLVSLSTLGLIFRFSYRLLSDALLFLSELERS